MTPLRERLWLFAIILVALSLRTAYLLEFSGDPEFTAPSVDAGYHDYWARALAFGDWTPPEGLADPLIRSTPYFRPPGYPYFLAAVYALLGPGYLAPRIIQMLLGVVNCLLAFVLARRLFGRGVALLMAAFMSCYWSFIYFEMEFLEPVVAITLALLLVYALMSWTEAHTQGGAVTAGVVLGLFALVRSNVLLPGMACVGWSWWLSRRQGVASRRWIAMMTLFAGAAALVILPATVRNFQVAYEFVPISANTGIALFFGNNEKANGMVAEEVEGLGPFRNCFEYPALVRNLERRLGKPLSYSEASAYFQRKSWEFVREHPRDALALALKKTLLFWGPLEVGHNREDEIVRSHSRILRWLPGGFSLALTSFVLGLMIFSTNIFNERRNTSAGTRAPEHETGLPSRRQFEIVLLVAMFAGAYFVSHLPFFVAGRYRIPLVPFLLLLGAYGVHWLWLKLVRARELKAIVWLIAGAALFMVISNIRTEYRPSERGWLFARGVAFSAGKDWDRAATAFKGAAGLDHASAEAFFGAGIALAHQQRLVEAKEYLKRAVALRPSDPNMHNSLGAVYLMSGEMALAEAEIQQALRLDPSHQEARRNQSAIEERRRRTGWQPLRQAKGFSM